uniref:Uncharacterized protein n=1 Tax=Steinernema glaseri TaxID=37863 RepID=A0A1I8A977_9BILA
MDSASSGACFSVRSPSLSKEELLEKRRAQSAAQKRSFLVRMVSDPKCYNPKIVRHLNMTNYRKMSQDVYRDRTLRYERSSAGCILLASVLGRPSSTEHAVDPRALEARFTGLVRWFTFSQIEWCLDSTHDELDDEDGAVNETIVALQQTGLQTPM